MSRKSISIEALNTAMEFIDPWYGNSQPNTAELLESLKGRYVDKEKNGAAYRLFRYFQYGPKKPYKNLLLIFLWVNILDLPVYKDRGCQTREDLEPEEYAKYWAHMDDYYIRIDELLILLNKGDFIIPKVIEDLQGELNLAKWKGTTIQADLVIEANDASDQAAIKDFDVFISHNSHDKSAVRELVQALKSRNLKVWLDEEQLRPGLLWQKELERIIRTTCSAAVLVGKDGLGPWEDHEMRACLNQFVNRKLPVIPVLLPEAPNEPELPLFLAQFTWVDMRGGLTKEILDRLFWGITGEKINNKP